MIELCTTIPKILGQNHEDLRVRYLTFIRRHFTLVLDRVRRFLRNILEAVGNS